MVRFPPLFAGTVDNPRRVTEPLFKNAVVAASHYEPPKAHWFYAEVPNIWKPFSGLDSVHLEKAYELETSTVVATDDSRYDANVAARCKRPVYWDSSPEPLCRATWFYRPENVFVPYPEDVCERLEELYRSCVESGIWNRRLEISKQDSVVLSSANHYVHFYLTSRPDEWGMPSEEQCVRTLNVRRGAGPFLMFEPGESEPASHLVFVVHGIGSVCDMRFRDLRQCLDDTRLIAQGLSRSHLGHTLRVEFLPVSWHSSLHDEKLGKIFQDISLPSISRVRHFINNCLVDILLYTSPVYCQTIVNEVCSQLNHLYDVFRQRNPGYSGRVSLLGHSLGSVILFDLLTHQTPGTQELPQLDDLLATLKLEEYTSTFKREQIDTSALLLCSEKDFKDLGIPLGPSKKLAACVSQLQTSTGRTGNSAVLSARSVCSALGEAGTGQSHIEYPKLDFEPNFLFALGSPIAMFLAVRGFSKIDPDYRLPTCARLLNIFHPFDPVAYRLETMVGHTGPPELISHHKGRKRLHLALKDSLSKVGNGLKSKLLDIFNATLYSLNQKKTAATSTEPTWDPPLKGLNLQDEGESIIHQKQSVFGNLNSGNRIDFVLQERPLETINEYVFAMSSHACYWESEDTVLLILNQIHGLSDNSDPETTTSS